MVAGFEVNERLLERVAEVYRWLDKQIREGGEILDICKACGECCDFDSYDHRLFITTPELMFLAASLGDARVMPMLSGKCPYNIDGKCSVYKYRFSGCRIFCCSGDADFQSKLSEEALKKLKSISLEFQIPYRYTDLASGLNSLVGV